MFNLSTGFIDGMAKIGLAYDRKWIKSIIKEVGYKNSLINFFLGKSVTSDMIRRRAQKYGDGSWMDHENAHKDPIWGYGDKDIPIEDLQDLNKIN